MSEEMAVSDNATSEEGKSSVEEAIVAPNPAPEEASDEPAAETAAPEPEKVATEVKESKPESLHETGPVGDEEPSEILSEAPPEPPLETTSEQVPEPLVELQKENVKTPVETAENSEDENIQPVQAGRGIKRRASKAFSDGSEPPQADEDLPGEDFKGFDSIDENDVATHYSKVLERLEAEVNEVKASYTPLRTISVPMRALKRQRQDTDGSRPSSALSSKSDGDGTSLLTEGSSGASPAGRGRRPTVEQSVLLRIPLERGWKRELVYRAALDQHQRRNADIYYYTPQGKKLRSSREVSEHLSGTGLTLEHFSFFKEPLGVDDPEKEIIRDAKMMRRVESPVAVSAPVVEGKRAHKPKPPKGASPEHTDVSPPLKIRVKSMGSRLSTGGTPSGKAQKKPVPADNNNTAAWKKPRQPPPEVPHGAPLPSAPPPLVSAPPPPPPPPPPVTPPPLMSRPPMTQASPDVKPSRQVVQPCSLTCGLGVPTLSCGACLCLYHRACAGYAPPHNPPDTFFCKNCRKSSSPSREPPPLIHKSGVSTAALPAPQPRRAPAPVPVPVPKKQDKRVLLRMKVAGGGPDGERVWAVAPPPPGPGPAPAPAAAAPHAPAAPPRAPPPRLPPPCTLPQSLAIINGRQFIVVPRTLLQNTNTQHDDKRTRSSGRISNGVSEPAGSPRRRGRARPDDTDHFSAFLAKAKQLDYNVGLQIFQYLGMRDLAHCARVCRQWRELAANPALWRHVRMKNSHVSDWAGLCAALRRHGTLRLDLRKMLLPQNDTQFWEQFAEHIATVDTLERIEMCRCPARAVEAVCNGVRGLRSLCALAIRDALLDPRPLASLPRLTELRLKSMAGLSLTADLRPLAALTGLKHLSLTSIKELGWCASDIIGSLEQLESLELGECTFRAEFAGVIRGLRRLRRLRLERGTAHCSTPQLLRALSALPLLTRLELVNIDVKVGFDDALAECKNIQRLLIIPTYVSQSATTNRQVLSGVLRLKDTLTHLMWGVTIELLRVTELFIDQCEQGGGGGGNGGEAAPRELGECIPVLKPVPGCRLPDHKHVNGPPQVEILPLPTLQRLLSAQLPNTKLKLLRIPFHATWRQSLADFQ